MVKKIQTRFTIKDDGHSLGKSLKRAPKKSMNQTTPAPKGRPPRKSTKRQIKARDACNKMPADAMTKEANNNNNPISLNVASARPGAQDEPNSCITLQLTAPDSGEECSIAMEPIAEYRLPFIPATFKKQHLVKDQPALTKATLPCGHSFNALAVVYHFLKNSMTCPCCRSGLANEKMGEQFVPQHMRKYFSKQLSHSRAEEQQEQITTDAMAATEMLHHEVSYEILAMPVTRMVLTLSAYTSLDHSSSPEPTLALELPLTSSLAMGTMEFVSSGYSLHQLNLNLGILPVPISAFELGIGVRSVYHTEWSSVCLFKTVRFSAPLDADPQTVNSRLIPSMNGDPRLNILVQMFPAPAGRPKFARISCQIQVQEFTNLLVSTSQAMLMAAV